MPRILATADLHLRKDKPRCRLDDNWMVTQEEALLGIHQHFLNHNCDLLLIVGDISESTVPPIITSLFLKYFYPMHDKIRILPGNHCLRYSDIKHIDKASYGILRHIFQEFGYPYGTLKEPDETEQLFTGIHELVWPSKKKKPEMASGLIPEDVFKQFPNTKYIFTGDYHQGFTVSNDKGQCIINPGCITRQKADYKDYEPRVYIVDTDSNEITTAYLPDDNQEIVTDEYLRRDEERFDKIDSFIELVSGKKGEVSLDFKSNLKKKYKKINTDVKNEIESILEEVS